MIMARLANWVGGSTLGNRSRRKHKRRGITRGLAVAAPVARRRLLAASVPAQLAQVRRLQPPWSERALDWSGAAPVPVGRWSPSLVQDFFWTASSPHFRFEPNWQTQSFGSTWRVLAAIWAEFRLDLDRELLG
jgi:hypothetical protein